MQKKLHFDFPQIFSTKFSTVKGRKYEKNN